MPQILMKAMTGCIIRQPSWPAFPLRLEVTFFEGKRALMREKRDECLSKVIALTRPPVMLIVGEYQLSALEMKYAQRGHCVGVIGADRMKKGYREESDTVLPTLEVTVVVRMRALENLWLFQVTTALIRLEITLVMEQHLPDLCKHKVEFGVSINEPRIDDERQRLLWRSLASVCDVLSADNSVTTLLSMVPESKLLTSHLGPHLIKLRNLTNEVESEIETLLMDVLIVFKTMLQCLPSRATDVQVSFTLLRDAVEALKKDSSTVYISENLEPIIKTVSEQIEALEKEKDRKRQMELVHKNPPPDDFRQQAILPTTRELQAGYRPFLRPHITRGVYADGEHYLDVQFRLLKEDFVYPLRNGISEYVAFKRAHPGKRPRLQDVRIYEGVRFIESSHDSTGISHCLSFHKLARVRWESSKRLIYGSLVILSNDNFATFLFGTVANRDVKELEAGRVAIHLLDQKNTSCIQGKTFVMAESTVFFEAYRPVLLGLQKMEASSLPLSRYIIGLSHVVQAPLYLRARWNKDSEEEPPCLLMDIAPLLHHRQIEPRQSVAVMKDDAWPRVSDVTLDPSQLEAVKKALTTELSVIQGPPGTGKTYVGLKILHVLLRNRRLWSLKGNHGPILLVCYTNHALDQFLEGIEKFHSKGLVRVGSQSKSQKLQQYNLKSLLSSSDRRRKRGKLAREVQDAKNDLDEIKSTLSRARNGILAESELRPFMSSEHFNSLLRLQDTKQVGSWMVEWLLSDYRRDSDWDKGRYSEVCRQKRKSRGVCNRETFAVGDHSSSSVYTEFECERDQIEAHRLVHEDVEIKDTRTVKNFITLALDLDMLQEEKYAKMKSFIERKMLGTDRIHFKYTLSKRDVWQMSPNERWALYHLWLNMFIAPVQRHFRRCEKTFQQLRLKLEKAKDKEKVDILRKATIVGMTTTAAASNQQVLQRVRPKIMVVEEAAEVLEAHIITALHSSCQQLILIGDHQQLRPKPSVHMLAKKYHLDISLFERLINNGFPYTQLQVQHRMRPQIAAIMRKHFYDVLRDHNTVKKFKKIKGVTKSMFFIDHTQPEGSLDDIQSHFNVHEAEFLVALCQYLIQQGYGTHQITILTAYTGQLLQFKQLMDQEKFQGVNVTSIDNYQGEENDIILVSFVRSNNDGKIGFLGISNRLCVSLSRARKGMFCIGNFTMFAEHSELWKSVVQDLLSTESIGKSLKLQCKNHPHIQTDVKSSDDFEDVPMGGCLQPCETRLGCGHICRKRCHPTDYCHKSYLCMEPCSSIICFNNHICPDICRKKCPSKCPVLVTITLPCSHVGKVPCGDISDIMCTEDVEKTLQCSATRILPCHQELEEERYAGMKCQQSVRKKLPCGHTKKVKCWRDPKDILCTSECLKILPCGHKCRGKCGKPCTEKCEEMITRDDWPCKHTVTVKCCDKPIACYVKCDATLLCGHSCKGSCGECNRGRFHLPCTETCERMLICGHKCSQKCGRPCLSCQQRCPQKCRHDQCRHPCGTKCDPCMKFCDWKCPHYRCSNLCCEPCDRPPCDEPCPMKNRKCGHPCIGLCGEVCPKMCRVCDKADLEQISFGSERSDTLRYIQLEDCGHVFEVTELDNYLGYRRKELFPPPRGLNKIVVPSCPRCGEHIRITRRYSFVLLTFRSLQNVVKIMQADILNELQCAHQTLQDISATCNLEDTEKSTKLSVKRRLDGGSVVDHARASCIRTPILIYLTLTTSFMTKFQYLKMESETSHKAFVDGVLHALCTSINDSKDAVVRHFINIVTEQLILDVQMELRRQTMLIELLEICAKEPKRVSQLDEVKSVLILDQQLTENQLRSAQQSLGSFYRRYGFTRPRDLPLFDLPELVSSHLDVWRQCPQGHVLRSSGQQPLLVCPECDSREQMHYLTQRETLETSRNNDDHTVRRFRDGAPWNYSFTRPEELPLFNPPEVASSHLDVMWRQCPQEHVLRGSSQESFVCPKYHREQRHHPRQRDPREISRNINKDHRVRGFRDGDLDRGREDFPPFQRNVPSRGERVAHGRGRGIKRRQEWLHGQEGKRRRVT
ncbi:NFX1-type zinc finger-containing protein 1-like [Diadema setosum]|uniref:NFX1-type zinc finger-containing protein 1-like n=1 Tax=Diadema setosum TaxID=31175 RepID=UPI003B3A780A